MSVVGVARLTVARLVLREGGRADEGDGLENGVLAGA
jgi:hypothetical protein